jgi:hypothetical protein
VKVDMDETGSVKHKNRWPLQVLLNTQLAPPDLPVTAGATAMKSHHFGPNRKHLRQLINPTLTRTLNSAITLSLILTLPVVAGGQISLSVATGYRRLNQFNMYYLVKLEQ